MELSKRELAIRHVIQGQQMVARQRQRVEMLAHNGNDTTAAERTLNMFTRTLDIFEDDLRRILTDEPV